MKNCPESIFLIMKFLLSKISLFLFINTLSVKCDTECPINQPIYKNSSNSCVLEYCTNDQLNNKECTISNKIIKKQWINNILILTKSNSQIYPSIATGTNQDILFESNFDKNQKIIYSIEKDGRGYFDDSQLKNIKIDTNNLFNTYGNSYLFTLNNHKNYFKLSFYESIEIIDLEDKKYKNYKLENLLENHIKSYYNSLLRTKENNIFIYAYITTGNYLAMQKLKIVLNNFNNINFIEIIKTLIENEKTISKNSRKCLITINQFIECLDMDEEQIFYVRLYDINLNFINKFKLEKNIAPSIRAFSTYHDAVLLKNEISIFIYFTDISNNKAKPIVSFNKLQNNNNLVSLTDLIKKCTLFTNEAFNSYYFSDTDNSFTVLNDHYSALASFTTYVNQHLIITLFNLFNDDKSLRIHYFNVPLNDLYNINYYSNINSFYYNDYIGVQFVQLSKNNNNNNNNDNYIHSILLFSYVNSTDPSPVYNIFEKYNNTNNIYTINLANYVYLQNNIFCYVLTGIKIISLPASNTNIKITITGSNTQLRANDVISLNQNISISYSSNIEDVLKGNYFISFEPTLEEPGENEFNLCQFCNYDYLGEKITVDWSPDKFTGRKTIFKFTVGNCYKNCGTCINEGKTINDQKCETCIYQKLL